MFYRGKRGEESYPLQDDDHWISRFASLWQGVEEGSLTMRDLVQQVLADSSHWDQDLNQTSHLTDQITEQLLTIERIGMRAALAAYS